MKIKAKRKRNEPCFIFEEQNNILKVLFVAFIFIALLVSNFKYNLAVYVILMLYFLPCIKLLVNWLKLSLKLLPLFISLYLFVIFFKVDFLKETQIAIKIWFMLLLSVYLTKSSKFFRNDFTFLLKNNLFHRIYEFLMLVFNYLQIFLNSDYKKGNIEKVLSEVIEKSKSQNRELSVVTDIKREFWAFSNLYLMFYFTVIFLVLEI